MNKNNLILLFIIILVIIFIKCYGLKKGFDKLETIWLIMTLVVIYTVYKACGNSTYTTAIIAILYIVSSDIFRPCFLVWIGVLYCIISNKKFRAYRALSHAFFKGELTTLENLCDLPTKPTIILANYPSNYVEYIIHAFLHERVCLLLHGPAVSIVKHIYGKDNIIGVDKGSFESLQVKVKEKMDNGYHIFAYIERDYYNRVSVYDITELRTGMFSIAKNIGATITPVAIDHIDHVFGILENTYFNIVVGPTSYVTDDNIEERMRETKLFLVNNLAKMRIKKIIK